MPSPPTPPSQPSLDDFEIRCPKLGAMVTFGYCRREAGILPCSRALACWRSRFPAEAFFLRLLTPDQYAQCFEQAPKPKMLSLVELIEAARKRSENEKD